MSVRRRSARRPARRSAQQRHDLIALRERADVVAALLALPYLDTGQSAYVAQTSASTIRRACGEGGNLPHVRINNGKLIRIAPDDLRAWLRGCSGLAQAS